MSIVFLKILPFQVYFNPDWIADILSLAEVSEQFCATYDTERSTSIFVHLGDKTLEFQKCATSLYYLDTAPDNNNTNVTPYFTFVQTIKTNKLHFSCQELEGVDRARILQSLVG